MTNEKLILNGEINNYDENVVAAFVLPKEDGVVCISDDKTIKVWIKRSTGQYWPSICYNLPTIPSCMEFTEDSLLVFIGLDNGTIMEFKVAEDYNKISHIKNYTGHTSRTASLTIVPSNKLLVSCGNADKCILCFSTESGSMLSVYQHNIAPTSVQFDKRSSTVLAGDIMGNILVLSWKNAKSLNKVASIKKHQSSINQLLIVDMQNSSVLFSASRDGTIGVHRLDDDAFKTSLKLSGHCGQIVRIAYSPQSQRLLSLSEDKLLLSWQLDKERKPPADWKESDVCEVCSTPFYWNLKAMLENKTLGVRQHHCRQCGKAVCMKCSNKFLPIPDRGFELLTRLCDSCYDLVLAEKQKSLMTSNNLPIPCKYMQLDDAKQLIVTTSTKLGIIQIWDAKQLLSR